MMQETRGCIAVLAGMFVLLLFAYGIWQVTRRVHYRLAYKGMVQETVREMVKKEALQEAR